MFASSVYFFLFKGHLCKMNKALADTGLQGCCPRRWVRGDQASGSGGCSRTPPPLPNRER